MPFKNENLTWAVYFFFSLVCWRLFFPLLFSRKNGESCWALCILLYRCTQSFFVYIVLAGCLGFTWMCAYSVMQKSTVIDIILETLYSQSAKIHWFHQGMCPVTGITEIKVSSIWSYGIMISVCLLTWGSCSMLFFPPRFY